MMRPPPPASRTAPGARLLIVRWMPSTIKGEDSKITVPGGTKRLALPRASCALSSSSLSTNATPGVRGGSGGRGGRGARGGAGIEGEGDGISGGAS
eukprot:2774527-Prymnesium_polylepis.2